MPGYDDLIAQAEKREKQVRTEFNKFDLDNSGSIDMDEIAVLMDELGLMSNLKTNRVQFLATKLEEFDKNQDGLLSFEEFKKFYNAAKDDAAGRKPKKPVAVARTSTGLDANTQNARTQAMKDKAMKKAEEAEKLRKQNAEMKEKIKAKSKGADSKSLDQDVQNARLEMMKDRQRKKAQEKEDLKTHNQKLKDIKKNAQTKTDHDINDDVHADGSTMGSQRNKLAANGQQKLADRKDDYEQRERDLKDMKAATGSKTDHDINDDVHADGSTMGSHRDRLAADGQQKLADRKDDHAQNARDLKDIKKNAQTKTDHDINDDVHADGSTMGSHRDRLAADGQQKRADLADDHAQNARDLKEMKATTGSRTDHDISDEAAGIARNEIAALKKELGN